jgi:putative transposase
MIRDDGSVRKVRKSFNEVGHAHELTFSCYQRLPLLSKDRSRKWFVGALNRAREQHAFLIWAYVIMPEHAHALIYPQRGNYDISKILQSVKQSVSRRAMIFLKREAPEWLEGLKVVWPDGRVEHRFWQQGGGYDRNMFEPKTVGASVEYLHNNPVRRKLVLRAVDWSWSSARWYAGMKDGPLAIDAVEF